jgi:excisionase family DNA binding protein
MIYYEHLRALVHHAEVSGEFTGMATLLGEKYLSVDEAAAALRVNRSTIRRWMSQGLLPAYRVGQRRVVLKQSDVARLITPTHPTQVTGGATSQAETGISPKLTSEQQRQGLAAMAEARRLREELLRERGGELFSPSWEILNELRDERSRQLE